MTAIPHTTERLRWPEEVNLLPRESHSRMAEHYFALWAFLMPLSSFVLLPVQGTTPAYMMAFISPIFCIQRKYFSTLACFFLLWLVLLVMSQLGLLLSGTRGFLSLLLIEQHDTNPVFRTTLLTQSLYLLAAVLVFMFVKTHFKPHMMRYVFWGAWFLVIYGIYDWCFFMLTGTSGDFLANRTFSQAGGDSAVSSTSQYAKIGPLTFLRFKSMTEEPSRFAMVACAYLSLAIAHQRRWLSFALLLGLMLAVSTTGLLSVVVMLALFLVLNQNRASQRFVILIASAVFVIVAAGWIIFPQVIDEMILDRLRGEHMSAVRRTDKLVGPIPVFIELPWLNKIFGVGIGTCFLPGVMRMLINCGLVGLIGAVLAFAYPFFRLRKDPSHLGVVVALGVLAFAYTFVVSAVYVPVTWMILGIAYAGVTSKELE